MHVYPLLVILVGLLSSSPSSDAKAENKLFGVTDKLLKIKEKVADKLLDVTDKLLKTKEKVADKLLDVTDKLLKTKEKSPQVHTLCQPKKSTILQLNATSPPFVVRSPNFPKHYNNNLKCQLVVRSGSEPLVLTFKYSSFDVEYSDSCDLDYLCVHGSKFCGQWPEKETFQYILPSNGAFTILLQTDESHTARGFDITVKTDLALPGKQIFQPQGDGSSEDQLHYVRIVYPSVPSTPDNCEATNFRTLSGD
ncbi:hypothetical protein BsWGS_21992 [Bradybaena similaris]